MVAEVGYSKYIYVCQIGESIKIFERGGREIYRCLERKR